MSDVNIQIKQRNGNNWDNLYPKTKASQVVTDGGSTMEQHAGDTTKHITSSERSTWNAKTSTTYVANKIAELVNSSPEALNTLKELATAIGNDANFATTMTNSLAGKVDKSSISTSASLGTSDTKVPSQKAVKSFVESKVSSAGYGDMMKSTYDTNNDGKADQANFAETAAIRSGSSLPSTGKPGEVFFQTL